ncbi:type IV pilin [Halobacteriales archaeon QS_5_68_33]|nr:MAG: type IV pilin [Halobacteriales archaeon QS_5_68_33]
MSPSRSNRAVSPVVGTVLLVAIAVALSALMAAVTFGTGGPREPAPDVVLELEQTDRPVAHELVVEGGDTLVGEKVEFRGTADEDPLAGRLRAGESVTVYPVEDTVRVVWFGEYGTTQILATFDPDPDLPL